MKSNLLLIFALLWLGLTFQSCRKGNSSDKTEVETDISDQVTVSENISNEREIELSSIYLMQKGQGVFLIELNPMELIINVFPDNDLNKSIQSIGPLQSDVVYNENYYLDDPTRIFNPADLNFDGHTDLRIPIATGTGGTWYAVYLFNASKRQFEEHPELSALVSLEADSVSQIITSHQAGGMGGAFYTHETYQWKQGKLVLVRRENQDVFYSNNPEVLLRSVVERNTQQRLDTTALVKIWSENSHENWCLLKGEWAALEGSPFLSEEAVKTDGRKNGCD
ncbi:MAG: hypothetical protein IPM71_01485 [Bacteroidota bacterium]|nr:MAG: hypothetical protein IPM71_01485 [Bacteroidota bacterium]